MGRRGPVVAVAAAFALTLICTIAPTVLAAAASPVRTHGVTVVAARTPVATTTAPGYDISVPQCGGAYPRGGSFGIVGVNGGLPWSSNSCLASEYRWAAALPGAPGLYMNTANPAPHSSHFWPSSGSSAPALCRDATSVSDPGCAYDYGWHAATDALAQASAALSAPVATSRTWWLDVETMNTWNGSRQANAADVQGAVDYLRSQGVPTVGIYSTGYQWGQITGGYSTSNAATYAAAWSGEFTSPYGIGSAPDWVATMASAKSAPQYCSQSFSGVPVTFVQYPSGGYDADLRC